MAAAKKVFHNWSQFKKIIHNRNNTNTSSSTNTNTSSSSSMSTFNETDESSDDEASEVDEVDFLSLPVTVNVLSLTLVTESTDFHRGLFLLKCLFTPFVIG